MKVYKVELMILDFDEIGEQEIINVIQETRYPNRCISPDVMKINSKEIGVWEDDNALNYRDAKKAEYERLFNE